MVLKVDSIEVLMRAEPRMGFTSFQRRRSWRSFNSPPRIYVRSDDVHLNNASVSKLSELLRTPVLDALGARETDAVLRPGRLHDAKSEPFLIAMHNKEGVHLPRCDLYVFVSA
jgi:hypothetical protein